MYTEAVQTGVLLVAMVIQHTQLNIPKHTWAADLKQVASIHQDDRL